MILTQNLFCWASMPNRQNHLYNTHNGNLYDYLIEKITDNKGNIIKNYKMMKKQK